MAVISAGDWRRLDTSIRDDQIVEHLQRQLGKGGLITCYCHVQVRLLLNHHHLETPLCYHQPKDSLL